MTQTEQRRDSMLRNTYPPGTRLELISMEDDVRPVPPGTRGTVRYIDDWGQLGVAWDNGSCLPLLPGIDRFRKLTPEELAEEQTLGGLECQTM